MDTKATPELNSAGELTEVVYCFCSAMKFIFSSIFWQKRSKGEGRGWID